MLKSKGFRYNGRYNSLNQRNNSYNTNYYNSGGFGPL